ncbi:MAG: tetratricopeptide repeat protein [Rhodanobacter sp.]
MKARAFFSEIKRRNVLRAGTFYMAAGWALAQGLAQLLPVFNAPNWITQWFVIACFIGFPFWVVFAWFYEFTPTGLKLESEIEPGKSIQEHTGKRADRWIIAVLGIAVVLLITNQFVLHRDAESEADVADAMAIAAALAKVPKQSVAVLPLANESGDPRQQYFSDGLSEELISDLTQVNGLKVIGKYSSFKFRDSKESPAQIGAALGVAHLILGSVQQQSDRIRVMVSMINAGDGTSVWSHSYDEPLKDVFAIQSQIGNAVAAALKIKLFGNAIVSSDKPPGGNVEAYQLMLQGHALVLRQTEAGFSQGIPLLQQAIKLDPDYAYAWGSLATAFVNLGQITQVDEARQRAYVQARVAANRQQALAPNVASTYSVRGYLLSTIDDDPAGALAEYKRALALAPNDGRTMVFLAFGLLNEGQLQPAAELFRNAIATDPLQYGWYAGLATAQLAQGRLDAAEQATRTALALQPDYPGLYGNLTQIDVLRGDAAAALRDAQLETDPALGPWARALAQQTSPDHRQADASLQDYLVKNGKTQPYLVADLFALRKQPDKMFQWLQRAFAQDDPQMAGLLYDPFVLAYQRDPRFVALRKQAGLSEP